MAQEQRRTGDQPERRSRASGRSRTTQNRGGRKKGRAATSFALLYVVFVIGISALLACIGWVAANDVLALNKEQKTVTVTISSEDSFGDVADMLKENGLIEYKSLFNLFATFTGSKDEVVPGTFTLNTNMDYRALLTGMSANSSSKATISVTIPEGYTIDQIFSLLEERNVASVEDLQDMAANHDYAFSFLQDIELGDYHRLEGYLFPDTYEFTTPENPLYVINKMLVQFDAKVTDEMRQEILNSGRSIHEVLTVASMIEKETDGSDRETIASVIYNRLNNPGAGTTGHLNIDATIQYVLPEGEIVSEEDYYTVESPYNTYLNKGLPPGPIANPGLESIMAALNPESTNYYYYALGDDGVHHFFTSYSEHQAFLNS